MFFANLTNSFSSCLDTFKRSMIIIPEIDLSLTCFSISVRASLFVSKDDKLANITSVDKII